MAGYTHEFKSGDWVQFAEGHADKHAEEGEVFLVEEVDDSFVYFFTKSGYRDGWRPWLLTLVKASEPEVGLEELYRRTIVAKRAYEVAREESRAAGNAWRRALIMVESGTADDN